MYLVIKHVGFLQENVREEEIQLGGLNVLLGTRVLCLSGYI